MYYTLYTLHLLCFYFYLSHSLSHVSKNEKKKTEKPYIAQFVYSYTILYFSCCDEYHFIAIDVDDSVSFHKRLVLYESFFCIFTKLCVSIESICLVSFSSFYLLSYFWIQYSISVIFVYCLHLKVRIVLQRSNNSTHRREQIKYF